MKTLRFGGAWLALLAWLCVLAPAAADELRPFVLASHGTATLDTKLQETRERLETAGFRVLGEYRPRGNAVVLAVTSDDLLAAATQSERAAYGAVQRVSIATGADGRIQVAYANPRYIQQAYRMKADLGMVANKLAQAIGSETTFGAPGMTADKLKKYRYMFGMERFDDPYKLAEYPSHQAAVEAVEKGLAEGLGGITKVYRLDIPGRDQVVFGVAMKAGENGDKAMDDAFQMDVVDFKDLKQVSYLPYEILVDGKRVEALHMRFRMAVHFPDLKMMGEHSFMKLMSSPDAIGRSLAKTTGGNYDK
ncbi:MAG: hypothetical protein RBT51_05160 [Ectothiorhodospiraceae bacterium]|jgi:hypothetical protein|nr:hypothetical protein [Ectothiorhodospiraceae bacterium]